MKEQGDGKFLYLCGAYCWICNILCSEGGLTCLLKL